MVQVFRAPLVVGDVGRGIDNRLYVYMAIIESVNKAANIGQERRM